MNIFTPLQLEIIHHFGQWLESREIDTSSLNDVEMWGRITMLKEIRNNTGRELFELLEEHHDKFLDCNALVMEMMMGAEGTRH